MQFRTPTGAVRVTVPTADVLWRTVEARLTAGEGFALATLNLDHLVKLRTSDAFARAYARHDLVTADGNPIVWMSRLAGSPVALLPGADLVVPLAQMAAALDVTVALVGSTDDSLARAAAALERAAPVLRVVARIAPPMGFDPDGAAADAILSDLAARGVGLCLLALGAPRQERLAARGRDVAPGVGFVSIGAGLDFLAGHQSRAPRLVRRLALEWLWRMASDPRRLAGRYLRSAMILPGHAWRSWRART